MFNQVESSCRAVETLGLRLQLGSSAFPVLHVACRLEEVAQGLWPRTQEPSTTSSQRIANCLVQVESPDNGNDDILVHCAESELLCTLNTQSRKDTEIS